MYYIQYTVINTVVSTQIGYQIELKEDRPITVGVCTVCEKLSTCI